MTILKTIILHIVSLPAIIVGYAYVLLARVTFLARDVSIDKSTWAISAFWKEKVPWFGWSTTAGYGFVLSRENARDHEMVHVRQMQDACMRGFVLAWLLVLLTWNWAALLIWPLAVPLFLMNYVTGWLRGGHIYRGAEHEKSAYAQTKP